MPAVHTLIVPERSTEETILMASLFLEPFDSLRKVKPGVVGGLWERALGLGHR